VDISSLEGGTLSDRIVQKGHVMSGKRILCVVLLAEVVLIGASMLIGRDEARNAAMRNRALTPPTEEELVQARREVPDSVQPPATHPVIVVSNHH
jgi:hypothetical protein